MLCLVAGSAIVPLLASAITLAWTHSVERIAWEEAGVGVVPRIGANVDWHARTLTVRSGGWHDS